MGRKSKIVRLCPRCGKPMDYFSRNRRGNRVYVYAVHVISRSKDGKRKIKKCYLGPEEGYEYVSRLHQDLGIKFEGLHDRKRVIKYLREIINYVENTTLDEDQLEELLEIVNTLQSKIKDKLEEVYKWES